VDGNFYKALHAADCGTLRGLGTVGRAITLLLLLASAGCVARQPVGEELVESRRRTELLARLGADPDTAPFEIGVELIGGVVRLTGEVATGADREEAERIAAAVDGVTDVINLIAVSPQPAPAPPPDDPTIDARVLAKLAADPELHPFPIEVRTTQGKVTLRGSVGSEEQRREAERLARATTGVRAVTNEILVVPPAEPDGTP
jgi:osmotically-inducible protein OsmY